MPFIVFSGFLQQPKNIKPWFLWLYDASFFQYGFQSLAISEFAGGRVFANCTAAQMMAAQCPFGQGVVPTEIVLTLLDYDKNHLSRNLGILGGFFGVFAIAGHLVIKFQAKRRFVGQRAGH